MAAKAAAEKPSPSVPAFEFLETKIGLPLPSVVACFGTDDFLRRTAIHHLIEGSGIEPETVRSFDGETDAWREIHDELATRSLFDEGGIKIAIVRDGDKFLSKNREPLERWTGQAAAETCLILEVHTMAATTTLYKLIAKNGMLVKCTPPQKSSWGNPPDEKAIQKWVIAWARSRHSLNLSEKQSAVIVDRVGGVCGLIDCEIAKLALFADEDGKVSDQRVAELVGGWRTQTAWELSDAIAEGQVALAIQQLDKLFTAGQTAVGLVAQMSWSLRRYGLAAKLIEQSERVDSRIGLSVALERAGFNRFDIAKAEVRLKRIGRPRAREMLAWLVDLELKLKGSHSNEHRARLAIEALIMKLG